MVEGTAAQSISLPFSLLDLLFLFSLLFSFLPFTTEGGACLHRRQEGGRPPPKSAPGVIYQIESNKTMKSVTHLLVTLTQTSYLKFLRVVAVPATICGVCRLKLMASNVCLSFFWGGPADIVTISVQFVSYLQRIILSFNFFAMLHHGFLRKLLIHQSVSIQIVLHHCQAKLNVNVNGQVIDLG